MYRIELRQDENGSSYSRGKRFKIILKKDLESTVSKYGYYSIEVLNQGVVLSTPNDKLKLVVTNPDDEKIKIAKQLINDLKADVKDIEFKVFIQWKRETFKFDYENDDIILVDKETRSPVEKGIVYCRGSLNEQYETGGLIKGEYDEVMANELYALDHLRHLYANLEMHYEDWFHNAYPLTCEIIDPQQSLYGSIDEIAENIKLEIEEDEVLDLVKSSFTAVLADRLEKTYDTEWFSQWGKFEKGEYTDKLAFSSFGNAEVKIIPFLEKLLPSEFRGMSWKEVNTVCTLSPVQKQVILNTKVTILQVTSPREGYSPLVTEEDFHKPIETWTRGMKEILVESLISCLIDEDLWTTSFWEHVRENAKWRAQRKAQGRNI